MDLATVTGFVATIVAALLGVAAVALLLTAAAAILAEEIIKILRRHSMNELRDLIEVTGNLVEEAWNNGRREAMKEIQGGKYERIEEVNSALRGQIDNYEKLRAESSKEIDRLKANLEKTWEEKETLQVKHDNYERNRYEASKEIDRLTEQVRQLNAESDLMDTTIENLRKKLEDAEAKIKEQNEALAAYREPTPAACPFCGGRPDVVAINKERWVVACHSDTCAVNPETDAFDTIEEAVSAWNHRAGGLTCDWR